MNLPFSNKKTSASKGCFLTIAIVVALVLAVGLGRHLYGSVSPAMLLLIVVAVGFVIIYLLNQRTKNFSAEIDSLKEKRAELIKIGTKYNKDVKQLEADFRSEKKNAKILLLKDLTLMHFIFQTKKANMKMQVLFSAPIG